MKSADDRIEELKSRYFIEYKEEFDLKIYLSLCRTYINLLNEYEENGFKTHAYTHGMFYQFF